jgi:polyisoprenoid-binding protein YceI
MIMAWQIDPAHSQLEFKVRHMMLSNVRGRFENFSGTVEFDEANPLDFSVDVQIDATSIYTRESQRDAHLKSPDFLMADEYPTMGFRSTKVEKTGENTFRLHGDLTIRDVTRPVVLDGEYNGVVKSPWGTTSAGFEASGAINRKEWGLVWNHTLEAGGVLVGEEVKITINVELVKQEAAVPAEENATA